MADKKPDPWPKWHEPATKGDIVSALVGTRSCMVDILICLRALEQNNKERFREYLEALNQHDDKLQELLDDIGGATSDE